jgi:hypothetical protein
MKRYSLPLLRDENFISSNMANGVSKNPSFHTDFRNVNLIFVKSAPKNVLGKNCFVPEKSFFWTNLFLSALFTFLKSVLKDGFFLPLPLSTYFNVKMF